MSITRAQKVAVVKDLKDKLSKAKIVVFNQYRNLPAQDLVNMRKAMRAQGIDYKVAKKTLISLVLKDLHYSNPAEDIFDGPVSVAISYDDILAPAKILNKWSKDHEGLKILGGYMNERYISRKDLIELAGIESKEYVLSKLLCIMNSPLRNFASLINTSLTSFVRILRQIPSTNPSH